MTSSPPNAPLPPGIDARLIALLLQPMSISTIASVGIHGVLLFMAPSLPQGQQAKAEGPKTVNVVQLTPEEQRRLPNFSKSIPALSNPLVTANPNFYSNNPGSLPNPSSLPPLPPVSTPESLPSLPDPTQLWGQVKPQTSFSIPAPQSGMSFPNSPSSPQQLPPPIPPAKAPPKDLPRVNPGTSGPETSGPSTPGNETNPQPPESSPSPSLPPAAEVQRQRDEEAARSNQPPGPSGYTRSIEGTSQKEQTDNLIALMTPFATAGQKIDLKNIEETLTFPDSVCPKDTGKAILSVVVNTADGVIQSTKMLQKSGYAALDLVSEAQAKVKTFEPNSKTASEFPITIYNYTFTFVEPEGGCKAAPTDTPTDDPTASPSATPSAMPSSN